MLAATPAQNNIAVRSGKRLHLNLHPGQTEAWESKRRFVFVIAGTQSGKTSFGPWWLYREIKNCGPGDYIAVTATYDLFKLKMLPEMRRVFEHTIGGWEYQASDRVLYSSVKASRPGAPTLAQSRIILRAASSPGGLESATAMAAWLDECGQDEFPLSALEAVLRRLSLSQGRILGTTTIYNLGWLKTQVYDRWAAGDTDYAIIQFKSIMNPAFPIEEYERARRTMQFWKFDMFYNANFTKPAGLIYDCLLDMHQIAPFEIPSYWRSYGGLDFGGVHTAAVRLVENPDVPGVFYLCDEYLQGGITKKEHAQNLTPWRCRLWIGGAPSEDDWRLEFRSAGLPINEPPISDVEVGINRVYSAIKSNCLFVFKSCKNVLDQFGRYARKLTPDGTPTEEIRNKADFHYLDAVRYIGSAVFAGRLPAIPDQPAQISKWTTQSAGQTEARSDEPKWRRY